MNKLLKDLQRLVSLFTKQAEEKTNQLGASLPINSIADLRQARQRFFQMEEQARKGVPLNFYLILGVEATVTAADLKKAYRKAALRHHPDKAGQSLARSESGDDVLWKEIAEEVYKDADRLFKMIGEAYTVLSDPTKRRQEMGKGKAVLAVCQECTPMLLFTQLKEVVVVVDHGVRQGSHRLTLTLEDLSQLDLDLVDTKMKINLMDC